MKPTPPADPAHPPVTPQLGGWSKALSYLTLSRSADILLWPASPQSEASGKVDALTQFNRNDRQHAEHLWKFGATLRLACLATLLPLTAWLVLTDIGAFFVGVFFGCLAALVAIVCSVPPTLVVVVTFLASAAAYMLAVRFSIIPAWKSY